LLVAPPGAGKGTQAKKLAARYAIVHISSGELLRKEVSGGTKIGRIAADYLKRGDLVPDELVLEMLAGPVLQAATSGGYILDGFPRTVRQAEEASRLAQQFEEIELQAVIHLAVRREELIRRLVGRARGESRSDDTEAVIAHRLEVFDAETQPLLELYRQRRLIVDIDGEQSVEKVFSDIEAVVDGLLSGRSATGVEARSD
jgi:adenylate kinase